jgi:spore germination protein (amino acid permease)
MDQMIHLEKISLNQLVCLVILTQVGVHVLKMPYDESRNAGYDSWLSILIGGLIAQAAIWIIYELGKRYPDRSLPQYISAIVGRPLGFILNFLIAAFFVESSLMVVVSYTDVINRWVLFRTPWIVLIGVSFIIIAYISSSTLRSIATITQTLMLMFLICFAIIFISGMGKGDWRHFLPVGTHGIGAILKDSFPAIWAYSGYELLLFVFPFLKYHKKKDILIAMSVANAFTTLFYVSIAVIVTYNFSESQLKSIPEPMIFILRKFNWPVVQSLDILFMTIWVSMVAVTGYVYLYLSARFLAFVGSKEIRNHTLLVWILTIVCFVVGLWGSDRQWLLRFTSYHDKATGIFTVIVPTLLFLTALVRRKAAGG